MAFSGSNSADRVSPHGTAHPPFATVPGGSATIAVGIFGAAMIILSTTTSSEMIMIWMIAGVSFGQVIVFHLLGHTPLRYRFATSIAMLAIFLTALIPRLLQMTPMDMASGVALGVAGSLPMLGIAAWLLRAAQRRSPTQPSR